MYAIRSYYVYFALTSGGAGATRWQTSKGEPTPESFWISLRYFNSYNFV